MEAGIGGEMVMPSDAEFIYHLFWRDYPHMRDQIVRLDYDKPGLEKAIFVDGWQTNTYMGEL